MDPKLVPNSFFHGLGCFPLVVGKLELDTNSLFGSVSSEDRRPPGRSRELAKGEQEEAWGSTID
jgi:hypothetical protein